MLRTVIVGGLLLALVILGSDYLANRLAVMRSYEDKTGVSLPNQMLDQLAIIWS